MVVGGGWRCNRREKLLSSLGRYGRSADGPAQNRSLFWPVDTYYYYVLHWRGGAVLTYHLGGHSAQEQTHGQDPTHRHPGSGPREGRGLLRRRLRSQTGRQGRQPDRQRDLALRRHHESHLASFPGGNEGRQRRSGLGRAASHRLRGRGRGRDGQEDREPRRRVLHAIAELSGRRRGEEVQGHQRNRLRRFPARLASGEAGLTRTARCVSSASPSKRSGFAAPRATRASASRT